MNADKAKTAYAVCRAAGIAMDVDFHTLGASDSEMLHNLARQFGYRKPRDANGSTARYFYAYAQRGRISP